MKEKYNELEGGDRPLSPTDTNISTGSQGETSMYGSVFRRASNAIIFLRQISNYSKENSPHGSRLTVRDIEDDASQNVSETNLSTLPPVSPPSNNLQLPKLLTKSKSFSDELESSDTGSSSSSKKKKKKSKKKHRENQTSLQVPEINILP